MIQRFVCFKFKENTPAELIEQHMEMFLALKTAIPQIVSYQGGLTYTGGEGKEKFDSAHYVTYNTKEDVDIYYHHEAHQQFIEKNKMNWADVLVIDSEIQ